ncbi:hypothetical protein OH492_23285 [Vibrio chagasii]|nr:hypothetical protein [Vibrio chagasii]
MEAQRQAQAEEAARRAQAQRNAAENQLSDDETEAASPGNCST